MEQMRGLDRGSYIWGPSVHNTRIERLWYDVTHGFGRKWKEFFWDLEIHHGLNVSFRSHKWLLSYLFLQGLNEDAQDWAAAWNAHTISLRGERNMSPRELWLFGTHQHGARGLEQRFEPINEQVAVPEEYGIDWEVMEDEEMMEHFQEHNNALSLPASAPTTLASVPCEPADCPLTREQIVLLELELIQLGVNRATRDMLARRIVWQQALTICSRMNDVFRTG
ncbi:hypothetical protein SCHPADRAFT_915029 [Schizopora paradoxa]|uniref:Integrase core domain-containing protein n=1 Tax=Schizopora paradoxa TaxID=27342 RepID=A0A0H2RQ15_9AGAM|nr:hypothetical protein SCHPADRAFT_915029 [Schizopora paradoxa]